MMMMNMMSLASEQTRPLLIARRSSQFPEISSSPSYTFSLPTYQTLTNAFGSLKETVYNYAWDDSAFKKLGWPPSDETAKEELKKTQDIYKRMNDYYQTRKMYDAFLEDRKAISRRYTYCQRVLEALPTIPKRSEALELATFCLKYHYNAMNDFDKSNFLLFVTMEKEKSTQEVKKADLELAQLTIVPDDNELLKNLFDQTIEKIESKKDSKK